MKQTGRLMIRPTQLERFRKIGAAHGWLVGSGYLHGSHNEVARQLADGRALLVNLPDPTQRTLLGRFLQHQLELGRDQATTAALTTLLTALTLADELATEAAEEKTAEEETKWASTITKWTKSTAKTTQLAPPSIGT